MKIRTKIYKSQVEVFDFNCYIKILRFDITTFFSTKKGSMNGGFEKVEETLC